jgi:hypothetical protein
MINANEETRKIVWFDITISLPTKIVLPQLIWPGGV